MLTINTNTTSLITQMNLTRSNNCVQKSIERMSTGYKINHASDDAANTSISKKMSCQISGTDVALDNAQQAINLLQTADGSLDVMQANLLRIRDLAVQASNGTYSAEEKAMIQEEINQRVQELFKQRNNTTFNQIKIFGDEENPAPLNSATSMSGVALASTVPLTAGTTYTSVTTTSTAVGGTKPVTPLTEAEAIAQGYTCIHNEAELAAIATEHYDDGTEEYDYIKGKYCLMGDIDFSKVSGWSERCLGAFDYDHWSVLESGEFNGNGYSINNYSSSSNGLFATNYGTVKNLSMNNVNIDTSNGNVGAITGFGFEGSTIENCSVSGSIKGDDNTGGLVGANGDNMMGVAGGKITDCSSSATVTGTGNSTGGLVGYNNDVEIKNCSSSGTVTGTGNNTGGLVGECYGDITGCSSSAKVTGTGENTGGLVGDALGGKISQCSSSATVIGVDKTGGLVGQNMATIDKSYSTSNVKGNDYVGGIAGSDWEAITNSYSLGNVSGHSGVGGAIGTTQLGASIETSYSTGNVTGTGEQIGGFVGSNSNGMINNSYSSSGPKFCGQEDGTTTNCHGTVAQTGVTAHGKDWFKDSSNLSFLGSAYDLTINPPDLVDNKRPAQPVPPPSDTTTVFQIGANSGEENTLTIDTGFSLNGYSADVRTVEAAQKTIVETDEMSAKMSSFRSTIGAMQNRIESVMESLSTRKNNLEASQSTIIDTDFALESSKLVQQQILQNVASSLLAQANTNPQIALKLLM